MKQAKRAVTVKEIAALRETNPDVSIVSTLDMEITVLCQGYCQQGEGSQHVFHTTSGKQIQKPMDLLNLAWVDAGMGGCWHGWMLAWREK